MNIDEELFRPLAEFFLNDDWNPQDLKPILTTYGRRGMQRGFELEAYVKWALSRFARARNDFYSTQIKSGTLPNGHTFTIGKYGNISFYNPDKTVVTEIDDLYEFSADGLLTPVIFEATFTRSETRSKRMELKREMVQYLYEPPSYFCKIRPPRKNGDHGPGLYGIGYQRTVIIPGDVWGRPHKVVP